MIDWRTRIQKVRKAQGDMPTGRVRLLRLAERYRRIVGKDIRLASKQDVETGKSCRGSCKNTCAFDVHTETIGGGWHSELLCEECCCEQIRDATRDMVKPPCR